MKALIRNVSSVRAGDRELLMDRCWIMGVLNVTPDSFSDGGHYPDTEAALRRVGCMVDEGADIVDVGGESTRPGAGDVSADIELSRVMPVIERVAAEFDVAISIDTSKPEVMREAVMAGAVIVNDVRALQADGALATAAGLDAAICLMHMQGKPRTMQRDPKYADVTADIRAFLEARIAACEAAGIARNRLLVDPGFGFGKTLPHNLRLLRELAQTAPDDIPIVVGMSRKTMLGQMLDRPVDERLYGGLALAVLARQNGACVIRTHDVGPTKDALRVLAAVNAGRVSD